MAQVRLEVKCSTLGSPPSVPLLKHHMLNPCCQLLKKMKGWAGQMARRLRALDVLPEALSSITSSHEVSHNHLYWNLMPFLTCRQNAIIHNK